MQRELLYHAARAASASAAAGHVGNAEVLSYVHSLSAGVGLATDSRRLAVGERLGADAACCTTRFENAHRTVRRELLYRLHPWFGRDVFVRGATGRGNGVFRCTLDGSDIARSLEIPSWIFDCAACVSDVRIDTKLFSGGPHVFSSTGYSQYATR
jgi:hypothetical protein